MLPAAADPDRLVLVEALKLFDDYRPGQFYWLPMSDALAHLICSHYFTLWHDPAWLG
jgi:hypothetical protein